MLRTLALLGVLTFCAISTPLPWGALWLAVPLAVAVALLLCWRWGPWGVGIPVLLMLASLLFVGPFRPWAWWLPVAALSGSWMGLREEGGGPGTGRQAWMLLPILLLAAGLPWTLSYPELLGHVDAQLRASDEQMVRLSQEIGYQGPRLDTLQRRLADAAELRKRLLPHALPSILFLWIATLVMAGRGISGRLSELFRWPPLSRARLADWRLPDGALWLLILGLGLLVSGFDAWSPTAWTLLVIPGLGYCLQGIAVVESLLLARGVPPSIIVLTMLFVFIMATPAFILATLGVGLSDVWLDYRRLEATNGESL